MRLVMAERKIVVGVFTEMMDIKGAYDELFSSIIKEALADAREALSAWPS